jgi:hypothetical protein
MNESKDVQCRLRVIEFATRDERVKESGREKFMDRIQFAH